MVVGDYTTQYIGGCNTAIGESLKTNQYNGLIQSHGPKHFPAVWPSSPITWEGLRAMVALLQMEPTWSKVQRGDRVSVRCHVVVLDSTGQKHLCRSAIKQDLFTATGMIARSCRLKEGSMWTSVKDFVWATQLPPRPCMMTASRCVLVLVCWNFRGRNCFLRTQSQSHQ